MHMLEGREQEARVMLMRCMNVSGRVKQEVIDALVASGVEHMVAPFEADSQLAYMSQQGEVEYIISEDSDMLVYGCEKVKKSIIITKMSE
jgi:exonuclease-1